MISLDKKFLFIHVPKTGGNSIQNVLKQYSEDNVVALAKHQDGVERFEVRNTKYNTKKHSSLRTYKREIEPVVFNDLFKFATIRNPWDMCVSFFFSPHRGDVSWDRRSFKEFISNVQTIDHYIQTPNRKNRLLKKLSFLPQGLLPLLENPLDDEVDFILRFENLNEDFKTVCNRLDLPCENLPHRNRSTRDFYTKYYDRELIQIVEKRFFREIKFGEYCFGD
jgi:hypothetical protein